MEPKQTTNGNEEEVFDLGNFSDYDEHEEQDACGGDNAHKSEKHKKKTAKTCQDGSNKTCTTECQAKTVTETIDPSKLCKKCKVNKGTLIYRSEPACKECYLSAMEHRFRSSLRTQVKLSKKDDEVLCCLSGGQNSLAMCRMISECLYNPGPRRMFFQAQAVHVNEAAAMGASDVEETENINRIKQFETHYKLETTILNIEDIYDIQNEELINILHKSYGISASNGVSEVKEDSKVSKEEKRNKLSKLLASLSDMGSTKEDVLFTFKKLLIADFALKKKIPKVFFADTAQKVAINSLTLLCKGRGADIFDKVVPEEKIFADITFYRPMNDFLTKEILVYDHFNKLGQFYILYPKLEDSVPNSRRYPGNGSINTLLENFVDKLQAGFPSTVHTVLNTLNKIKPKYEDRKICPVCWGRKDKLGNILEKGSIIQYLKSTDPKNTTSEQDNKGVIDMEYESNKIKEDYLSSEYFKSKSTLEKVACFSCGRIFENAKDEAAFCENLPQIIHTNAESVCQQTMPKGMNKEAFDYYFYDYEEDY